jgi:hypothetical protein
VNLHALATDLGAALAALWQWFSGKHPLLQGIFGGIGVTLLWEAVLKPWRERRAIARALLAEVQMNLERVIELQLVAERNPKSVPGDLSFSTTIYVALAARLGELPHSLLPHVVVVYRGFDYLSALVGPWHERVQRYYEEDGGAGLRHLHETHLRTMAANYREALDETVHRARDLYPRLFDASKPWFKLWSKPEEVRVRSVEQIVAETEAKLQRQRELEEVYDKRRESTTPTVPDA